MITFKKDFLKNLIITEIYIDIDKYTSKKHVIFSNDLLEEYVKIEWLIFEYDDNHNMIIEQEIFDDILKYDKQILNSAYNFWPVIIEQYLEARPNVSIEYWAVIPDFNAVLKEFYKDAFYSVKSDSYNKRMNSSNVMSISFYDDENKRRYNKKPVEIYQEMWFTV